jgi:hypothetical protein
MTLAEFLLARIAEDEDRAEQFERDYAHAEAGDYGSGGKQRSAPRWWGVEEVGFTPNRIRAECEAKRRIASIHTPNEGDPYEPYNYDPTKGRLFWCRECDHSRDYVAIPHEEEGCPTLLALAQLYVDHPDFRDEWLEVH